MIAIVAFLALVIWIFCYHYFHISDPNCRKATKDGVTYKDAFGKLRLLRNGKRITYRKNKYGQTYMCYNNGNAVNEFINFEEAAKFKNEKDYVCDKKNGIWLYKIVETGEIYAKEELYGRFYYIDYAEDRPMKIIREVDPNAERSNFTQGIDINVFNHILEEMYNEKWRIITSDYFGDALRKYIKEWKS